MRTTNYLGIIFKIKIYPLSIRYFDAQFWRAFPLAVAWLLDY